MRAAILLPLLLSAAARGVAGEPTAEWALPHRSSFEIEMETPHVVATAQADDASLPEVAHRLEQVLGIPVTLSGAPSRRRVSFPEMTDVPLEAVLLRIAPVVHLDVRESPEAGTTLLAVHLGEEGSPGPRTAPGGIGLSRSNGDMRGGNAAPAVPGEPVPDEGPFLRVRLEAGGLLSVDARDQGLGVLLFEVAQVYGGRLDFRIPEAPVVDRIEVSGIAPSQLPLLLGIPGVGVDVRRNAATGEEILLRCFVEAQP